MNQIKLNQACKNSLAQIKRLGELHQHLRQREKVLQFGAEPDVFILQIIHA